MGLAIYFIDKAGKSNALLNAILLFLMAICLVHPAMSIPWIWSPPEIAMRIWRGSVIACFTLLAVAWFGIWTWPKGTTSLPTSFRLKYSSRQTLECDLGDPTQTINLDNVAMLTMWSCGRDSVEFLAHKTGSVTVKEPKAGHKYPIGGGLTAEFNPDTVSDATVLRGPAKEVKFSADQRVQFIAVGDRRFRVALDQIIDNSTKDAEHFSYVFSISDQ